MKNINSRANLILCVVLFFACAFFVILSSWIMKTAMSVSTTTINFARVHAFYAGEEVPEGWFYSIPETDVRRFVFGTDCVLYEGELRPKKSRPGGYFSIWLVDENARIASSLSSDCMIIAYLTAEKDSYDIRGPDEKIAFITYESWEEFEQRRTE